MPGKRIPLARLLLAAGLTAACAAAPRALHPDLASARKAADEALLALALRFGPVELEPRFAALRPRLGRAGLVPSRVFDDALAWTAMRGDVRELGFRGTPIGPDRYAIAVAPQPREPEAPGEYRGLLQLARLRPGEFEWQIHESLALGALRGDGLVGAGDALLALVERAPTGDARPALRASLPRTAAALGRVFSLERLQLLAGPEGARAVFAEALLHPEWLQEGLPRYAQFLRRYVVPMQLELSVADPSGAVFWEATLRDGRFGLRAKLLHGALASLAGPTRRLGDRCSARLTLKMKLGLWSVGFSGLPADVALSRDPHALGFHAAFHREPEWQIPFIVAPFMRGSLRRPFEGEGALLGYELVSGAGAEASSLALRHYRLAVKESFVVRWLGGNVGGAIADFRRGAEVEADRFVREGFLALREDVRALLAPP